MCYGGVSRRKCDQMPGDQYDLTMRITIRMSEYFNGSELYG